jgi:predicted Zn-dependent protease
MVEFQALYYDGRSSASRPIRVRGWTGELEISGDGVRARVPTAAVKLEPPIGATRRILQLPEGAQLQTADEAAIAALFPEANALEGRIHRLERRWPYAVAAMLLVGLVAGWMLVYGVPIAARIAAESVPIEVEAALGNRTLATLDSMGCAPSTLSPARVAELRARFAALTRGLDDGFSYRLELRSCRTIGANAFALPAGTIVMTDGLVKLAKNDDEIIAVLAHEVGHVRHRHGLRLAFQSLGVGALIATLFGDAASLSTIIVAVPSVLVQTGYSRAFEEEADRYAFVRLKQIGISPRHFADILRRLEGSRGGGARGERALDYLSSHPATEKRIERALAQ